MAIWKEVFPGKHEWVETKSTQNEKIYTQIEMAAKQSEAASKPVQTETDKIEAAEEKAKGPSTDKSKERELDYKIENTLEFTKSKGKKEKKNENRII